MISDEKGALLRRSAAGDTTGQSLRQHGFDNDLDVLGRLGLRHPVAPMDGPDVAMRERARRLLREALAETRR